MSANTTTLPEPCRLLERDAGLAEVVAPERRRAAIEQVLAGELVLARGRWRTGPPIEGLTGIGLLVLGGLLVRRVGVGGRFAAELLGQGDVLRPWEGDEDPSTLQTTSAWRVLETASVAVLDDGFLRHLASYPELGGRLVGRAVTRSRSLAVNMAIVHQARVDVRLHMLLWHLAGRWGKVGNGGVSLPLRLTHSLLSELVAARRPTVTSALAQLGRRGLILQTDSGWLLAGSAPGAIADEPAAVGAQPA
jgi:CRP-like cAMP-binding protein